MLFAGFFFSSCKDEHKSLSVSESQIVFPAGGDTCSFEITSYISWTVSITAPWVTTSDSAGTGDAQLTPTASSHTTRENRSTGLIVSAGTGGCEVEIIQQASCLTFSTRELLFDAAGYYQKYISYAACSCCSERKINPNIHYN
ncbi:MAG: BACON domain-containing protein [Bacteroides sp.]|nr:BACON domain-containing protein [Bacteroides sp.]